MTRREPLPKIVWRRSNWGFLAHAVRTNGTALCGFKPKRRKKLRLRGRATGQEPGWVNHLLDKKCARCVAAVGGDE